MLSPPEFRGIRGIFDISWDEPVLGAGGKGEGPGRWVTRLRPKAWARGGAGLGALGVSPSAEGLGERWRRAGHAGCLAFGRRPGRGVAPGWALWVSRLRPKAWARGGAGLGALGSFAPQSSRASPYAGKRRQPRFCASTTRGCLRFPAHGSLLTWILYNILHKKGSIIRAASVKISICFLPVLPVFSAFRHFSPESRLCWRCSKS